MTLTAHTVAQFTQPPSVALFRQFQCVYLLEKMHFIYGLQRTTGNRFGSLAPSKITLLLAGTLARYRHLYIRSWHSSTHKIRIHVTLHPTSPKRFSIFKIV